MKRLRFTQLLAIIALCVVIALVMVSSKKAGDPVLAGKTSIRLQLQWFDQAQFIGFYVAQSKGYYRSNNLDVTILSGGYTVNPIQRVMQGEANVGIATGDQVLLQRVNHPIKAIGTVFYKSIAAFMFKSHSTPLSPSDLKGKRIAVYQGFDTETLLLAILNKHEINRSDVTISGAGAASLTAFENDEIDVFPAYLINEPIMMKQKGINVSVLTPEDAGVRFYSDTIFTTEKFLNENRDALKRFLAATRQGFEYAEQNRGEAIDILFKEAPSLPPTPSNREHQTKMLDVVLQNLRQNTQAPLLEMDKSRWQEMESTLIKLNKLNRSGYIEQLVEDKLLKE